MATLYKSLSGRVPDYYKQKNAAEKKAGHALTCQEFEEKYLVMPDNKSSTSNSGTSTFDPALCEIVYLWFSAVDDAVIDPFAGGSVRGIVAEELGRHYVGVDLRHEQIDANYKNADDIGVENRPVWICGDSMNIQELAPGEYDFLMTCPPYGDLEVYSDHPADISNMSDEDFDATYTEIIRRAVSLVRENRFLAVVVGNYRDRGGFMRDLCGLTIRAMEAAGARYYNDIVYVSPAGSVPVRAGASFRKSRKVGKIHQNLLVFCKGDPRKAAERLGDIQIPDLSAYMEEDKDES